MISLCLCTYNGEKTLRRQLNSLINQTKLPDEIIVIDDCSKDNTVGILKEFISNNPKINWKLTVRNVNVGWKSNFYDAINQATGDFVFLCDQDDYWMKDKIQLMSNIMEKNNSIKLLSSNYYLEKGGKLCKRKGQKYNNKIEKVTNRNGLICFNPGCTFCFRRELMKDFNYVWNKSLPHDGILWSSSFAQDGLYMYNHACIYWVRHKESETLFQYRNFSRQKYEFKKEQMKQYDLTSKYLIRLSTEKYLQKRSYFAKYRQKVLLQESLYERPTIYKYVKLFFYLPFYPYFKSYLQDLIAFKFYKK